VTPHPERVRIVHDSTAEDPRDWDDMCRIVSRARGDTIRHMVVERIIRTKGWETAVTALNVVQPVDDYHWFSEQDLEDKLWDDNFYETWLNTLKDELLVEIFHTQYDTYLAYTTPELCEEVGASWEHAAEAMRGSIETFKQWVIGDVYGYVLEECIDVDDGDWIEVDSCWGFYGSDPRTNGMAEHLTPEQVEQAVNAEIEYQQY
jgi:hypothetical protein